jgi:hypothetical protein
MPNSPVCTEVALNAAATCYKEGVMDGKKRLAIQVYTMMLELAALGGTDWSADSGGLLAASCAFRKQTMAGRDAMLTAIFAANAEGAGASVPDFSDAVEAVNCLLNYDVDALDAMWNQLICSLGYHETIT